MKLRNRNIVELLRLFSETKNIKNTEFQKFKLKNYDTLIREFEDIEKKFKVPDGYTEYENDRIKLLEEHSKKDKSGKPVIENNQYVVENLDKWNDAFTKLKEKHNDVIEKYLDIMNKRNEFLEEELDINLKKIKFENLPHDLNENELRLLIPLVINHEKILSW